MNLVSSALRRAAFPLVAVLLLGIGPHARADDGGSWWKSVAIGGVQGSGNLKSEIRAATGFQAISLATPGKLVLRQGSKEGIEIRADDNLLPLFETRVVERQGMSTLEIRSRPGTSYSARTEPVFTVDFIKLGALAVSGSGDVMGDALKSPALKVSIAGSADVKIKSVDVDELSIKVSGSGDIGFAGRAGTLAVAIAGSGDVDTYKLETDDVTVNISGSGSASVNARKSLTVAIAGSGDVTYTGAANPKTSIAGIGNVKRK